MKLLRTYRMIALMLAVVMFTTSAGFSLDIHFCNGDVKGFSLVGKAQSCHSAKKKCRHHSSLETSTVEKKCCSNEKFELEDLDKDFVVSTVSNFSSLDLECSEIPRIKSYFNEPFLSPRKIKPDKAPPYYSRDIYVLLERFLL